MKKQPELKYYILYSWLIAGGLALAISLVLFASLGYFNYNKVLQQAQVELLEKANKAARRLSSELLIAPHGAPELIRTQLEKELNIEKLELLTERQAANFDSQLLSVQVPLPHLENKFFLIAATKNINVWDYFNFRFFFASLLLISLIVSAGFWLQLKYIKKHIIDPIEALVDTTLGEKALQNCPREIQEISERLNVSFKERDQAIFSQIARGVIHDIKTLLQSIQVATDLAKEKPSEARLKNLLTVSESKLPNLLSIIDTTLDGSREITVRSQKNNLITTIENSIDTSRCFAIDKDINIMFQNNSQLDFVHHDPTQLERVFTNVLKNAIEAVDTTKATSKEIHITCDQSIEGMLRITFEDNGPGISENPDSIFRLLKSTKPHGSGLGLLISKKIIEAHNGKLLASRSEKLKGAKFEVQLPLEVHL